MCVNFSYLKFKQLGICEKDIIPADENKGMKDRIEDIMNKMNTYRLVKN